MRADGTCPTCRHAVEPGGAHPAVAADDLDGTLDADAVALPWHFKLLAGALALYLGYRAFQGIEWLVGQL